MEGIIYITIHISTQSIINDTNIDTIIDTVDILDNIIHIIDILYTLLQTTLDTVHKSNIIV